MSDIDADIVSVFICMQSIDGLITVTAYADDSVLGSGGCV